jgi:hypothetical protein
MKSFKKDPYFDVDVKYMDIERKGSRERKRKK